MTLREVAKGLIPPLLLPAVRRIWHLWRPWDWELAADGWSQQGRGWDVPSVAETERRRWADYGAQVNGPGVFGLESAAQPSRPADLIQHNRLITHALVFALAGAGRQRLSVLDWGGGMGQLYLVATSSLPGAELEYHVKELPGLCAVGRELLPVATFHEDERCLDRTYDLVMAAASLQYAEDWVDLLRRLARAARSYLYIARVPVVFDVESFSALQRAHSQGYDTEYVCWVLNRATFLAAAERFELTLVREFLGRETPFVHGAREQFETRGFLFRV